MRALQANGEGLPFHFIDNVDPNGLSNVLGALGERLKTTLVITVSKSGGTPEPHLGMEQARHRLESTGGQWAAQSVVVTMADSPLDQQAVKEGWLRRFDMFDWVGGRTKHHQCCRPAARSADRYRHPRLFGRSGTDG